MFSSFHPAFFAGNFRHRFFSIQKILDEIAFTWFSSPYGNSRGCVERVGDQILA